jgi:hypothetical protein
MDDIEVDKEKLIKTLKKNRKAHRAIFLKGQEVYRQQMIKEIEQALADARNGGKITRGFSLPVPEDHTEDFDTVIGMLQWHQGEKIMLSYREYQTYIENKWGWQQSFGATTMAYAGMAP